MKLAVVCLLLSVVLLCNALPSDFNVKQTAVGKKAASNIAVIEDKESSCADPTPKTPSAPSPPKSIEEESPCSEPDTPAPTVSKPKKSIPENPDEYC